MLILPMHPMLDQHLVGAAVERLGAGRCLRRSATGVELERAIAGLLDDASAARAAAAIGEQIRRTDGAVTAVDAIAELVTAGSTERLTAGRRNAPGVWHSPRGRTAARRERSYAS